MKHTLKQNRWMLAAGVLLVGIAILIAYSQVGFGAVTKDDPSSKERFVNYQFFATSTSQSNFGTTTAATSTDINQYVDSNNFIDTGKLVIAGAKRVQLYFFRGSATSTNNGVSYFRIQTSPDGESWNDYGKLVLASTTNNNLVSRIHISSTTNPINNSTSTLSMDLQHGAYYAIRCIVFQSLDLIDGTNRCSASVDW